MAIEVSVVLPTFNRLRSLPAAVESVLSQSFRDLELIIVDDGSSEDIEGFAASVSDPRLKYVRRPVNGGAAAARNTGVSESRGRFIAFQDSDDLWLPGKLERQIALFRELPDEVGVVTGGKIVYGRDERYRHGHGKVAYAPPPRSILRLDEDQVAHLLLENRISLQNTLFKRSHVSGAAWFDSGASANEDWEFAIRTAQQTKIYEDIAPVVVGFVSPDSISTDDRKQTMGMLRILRRNRALFDKYGNQHSILLIGVAMALFRTGKYRWAADFLAAGLRRNPRNILMVPRALGREMKLKLFAT
ncbi:glycosyltransferase [Mesorhizobium sp. Root157]|uniref:glycosyltransferase family 2 protein n=1 Tax=Mesorhizobium sp. Root157 TaxID=1736477 RepID=UPI0007019E03|nr:glycosyltransferase family 2 protein [Mesorhizobium sp. Root157]KQZ94340.1 glycosyltransferase [Mesorhizobium sp. Root157]